MAKRVYKYPVPGRMTCPVSKWLQARIQNNHLMIWAELDDQCETQEWIVVYIGTGWEIDKNDELYDIMEYGQYCGSVEDESYIWHVYACPVNKIKYLEKEKDAVMEN